jgi:hypothetical protein
MPAEETPRQKKHASNPVSSDSTAEKSRKFPMEDDQSFWKKLSESIVIHCVGLGNDGGTHLRSLVLR